MHNLPPPAGRRYLHFGDALRHYRNTISMRLNLVGLPQMQVTATALLKCMQETTGFIMSQASYSDIENGVYLPRDPERFLHAVASCLAIEIGSLDWWILVQYISYDLIAQKLGSEVADEVLIFDEAEIERRMRDREVNGE